MIWNYFAFVLFEDIDSSRQSQQSLAKRPSAAKLRRAGNDNDRLVDNNVEEGEVGCCGRSGEGFRCKNYKKISSSASSLAFILILL